MSFASLAPRHRTEGTALFSLVRNLGSSVGISVVVSALSRNSRTEHAALAAAIDPSGLPLRLALESGLWRIDGPEGLAPAGITMLFMANTMSPAFTFVGVTVCPVGAHRARRDAAVRHGVRHAANAN
ncbi:MAG TPA: hypothetical protein PKC20_20845, partial [Burkholderiaceae bacterium]|nr:hypothetical protein [Burkholderiaceae bacterium]